MTTHVLMVTDASGSMTPLAQDVRGGHNQMLDKFCEDGGDYRITVTIFGSTIEPLCQDVPAHLAPRLSHDNYAPAGMTALLAAVAKTIEEFEERVALANGDRVKLVIQTDGRENFSFSVDNGRHTWQAVSAMLVERERRGWSIDYLGAGADAWDQGLRLGLRRESLHLTSATSAGTRVLYDTVTEGTIAYAAGASPVEVSGIIASNLDT